MNKEQILAAIKALSSDDRSELLDMINSDGEICGECWEDNTSQHHWRHYETDPGGLDPV